MNFYNIYTKEIYTPKGLVLIGAVKTEADCLNTEDLQNRYFYPVIEDKPEFDSKVYELVQKSIKIDDEKKLALVSFTTKRLPLDTAKNNYKEYVSNIRWTYQNKGILYNGYRLGEQIEERNYITGLCLNIYQKIQEQTQNKDNQTENKIPNTIDFKINNQWVSFTTQQLVEINNLIYSYIELNYNNEKRLFELIDQAKSFKELLDINCLDGWRECSVVNNGSEDPANKIAFKAE